ncbi:aldose 1-epimerase [Gleimia hominis]|uniref:aldose 1-epimerase n=1 Tax=Gleimia hominis TaxID=595468 RepID=UPI000C807396|nr:aldose 1-epimerase [Gleimia hominis]WIK64299.1 aldose 1-epimerase [Gleimia hominis]
MSMSETQGTFAQTCTIELGGSSATISARGATLRNWVVEGQQIVDGYVSDAEQSTLDGFRCAVLVPWSNRLANGQWADADGTTYPAPAPTIPDGETGLHGLVFEAPFTARVDEPGRSVVFTYHLEPSSAYPGALDIAVTYTLETTNTLSVKIAATNVGEQAVPVALGWHPYFLLEETIGQDPQSAPRIEVPSRYLVNTDAKLIPLDATAAYTALEEPGLSGRFQQEVGTSQNVLSAEWDQAVTGLIPDSDGICSAQLTTGRRTITVQADLPTGVGEGNFHLYTGAGLKRGPYQSVAMEPCQFIPNAFNRPELANALQLQPGHTRALNIRVHATNNAE